MRISENAGERWLPISGWPYEVSDLGRVRRIDGWTAGRVLKPWPHNRGYLAITLRDGPRKTARLVHRLVAEAFIGPRPIGWEIDHGDGDKTNNRDTNLEYVTASENMRRAVEKQLVQPPHRTTRLTAADWRAIRRRARRRESRARIAADYGISRNYVSQICCGFRPETMRQC